MHILNLVTIAPLAAAGGYYSTLYLIGTEFEDAGVQDKMLILFFCSFGYYAALALVCGIIRRNEK